MNRRVFIVHGWGGSPTSDFFPWLKEKLKEKGFEVIIPLMPDADSPKIENWVPHISKMVGKVDENAFFVGHSMGCQAILRFLETLPQGSKVGGAIFVAGFFHLTNIHTGEDKGIAAPWLETGIDLKKVRDRLSKSVAIFSDNDPYVPLNNKEEYENKLGSKIIIEHNKGHFNPSDGVTEFPVALDAVFELAK